MKFEPVASSPVDFAAISEQDEPPLVRLHGLLSRFVGVPPPARLPSQVEHIGHDGDTRVLVRRGEGDLDEALPRGVHQLDLTDEVSTCI